MASIRIPCLVGKTNKAGITSWYWQPSATLAKAGWKPLTLGKDEGAAIAAARARNAEVEAWKLGGTKPAEVKTRSIGGTLAALLDRYERDEWAGKKPDGSDKLKASTKRTYKTSLDRLRRWAGPQPLAAITPARVRVLRDAMLAPEDKGGIGHHSAHQTLKMGRTLFAFAENVDLIPKGSNPFGRFGLGAPAPRDVIWSGPAREAMILAAYDQGQPSIALAIMLGFAIGQREADLLALTERHYVAIPEHKMQPEDYATLAAMAEDRVPRGIRVRQQKTGAWIEVPVVGLVRWAIESAIDTARAAGSMSLLLDDRRQAPADQRGRTNFAGRGYGDNKAAQARFQRDFAEIREWAIVAADAAGDRDLAVELATLKFMDLRRTCVVYLGELGLDAHLIAGITGHDIDETQRILKTYMPRTTGRAARAIALASVRQAKEAERQEKSA